MPDDSLLRYTKAMLSLPMIIYFLLVLLLVIAIAAVWGVVALMRFQRNFPQRLDEQVETHHRAMLSDLHDGLTKQSDRILGSQTDSSERLRSTLRQELDATREVTHSLKLAQTEALAANREDLVRQLGQLSNVLQQKQDLLRTEMLGQTLQKLAEQGRNGTNDARQRDATIVDAS
jgi:DNA recombination protein RmuC